MSYLEFETPKGEKVCLNMDNVSFFCAKKNGRTLFSIGDYVEIEVTESYEEVLSRLRYMDFGVERKNKI